MYTTVGASFLISLTERGRPQVEAAAAAVVDGIVVAVGIAGFAVAAVDNAVVQELSQSKTERKKIEFIIKHCIV